MCKINGHSIFSYIAQPWNTSKLYTSKAREKMEQKAKKDAAETMAKNSKGDEISQSATTAKINKNKQNRTLSSLRVPLQTQNIGASVGSNTSLGLNLGG